MNKKGIGTLALLWTAALTIVSLAIMYGLMANVLVGIQSSQTAGTIAWNASEYGLQAIQTFSQWNPTLAIIIVAVVIIGLISLFAIARREKGGY